MKGHPHTSAGQPNVVKEWDGRDFLGRLQLVKDNMELFWDLGLITRSEIEWVMSMRESEVEYIAEREETPRFFTSLDLNKTLETQIHRNKLEAALSAVFSRSNLKTAA